MVDTRPRALEKARQRAAEIKAQREKEQTNQSAGSAFESERQRARMALREEIGSYDGTGIHKIAASHEETGDDRILNVAAYCRVSTDDIEQLISIEMQKKAYREKIKANPKWRFCGLYVDDGFSGTNTEHRPGFQRMMKDALAGKIDMIITKSVSRFARNLIDCISWVRRLKLCEPPVPVFFEQENLNTMDQTSNIILFVLAMVAEEESHMKSEAMLLSLEWRFSRGRFLTPKLLGYDKVDVIENGIHRKKLVINPEQADTVRLMYYMLLNGSTTAEIAATLTELERETGGRTRDGRVNTNWTDKGIGLVLRNERYCGDVLARKTWTPDFHTHKSVRNRNKKNKYYQPDHHEAIVTRAQWNAAQRILNSHRYAHKGVYQPMRVIDHGALCGYISVNRMWAGFEAEEYFRVCQIAMGLAEGNMDANLGEEHLPDGGHKIAGLTDDNGIQRISRELSEMEKRVKAQLEGRELEEQAREETSPSQSGFQVAGGHLFSQHMEPIIKIRAKRIAFNKTCVDKLNPIANNPLYVELLFNPVERMLAVRPCTPEHPNAILWSKGLGSGIGAKAFCSLLFAMMNWDENYEFRIPAMMRSRGEEKVILFDLDNYIGHETGKEPDKPEPKAEAEIPVVEQEDDGKGFFFAADEEQPEEIDDTEEIERRLREKKEIERKTFGTPLFEHDSHSRIPMIDDEGEWDIMAETRILDSDHQVDSEVIARLQDEMMEALYVPAEDEKEGDP